jgi:hypothetical protein
MRPEVVTVENSLPLSRYPIITTTRVDEAAETISRYQMPLRITKVSEPRRFQLDMNGHRLGRVFLGFNKFAVDTEVDPGIVEDAVIVVLAQGQGRASCIEIDDERVRVLPGTAAVVSPTRRTRIWRPSHSGVFVLRVTSSDLAARYEQITGKSARGPIAFAKSADLTAGPGRLLREHTHALITELQRSGPGPERKLFRTVLEDALISVILGLPGTRDGGFDVEPDLGLAPWAVRRAEEYMAAHAADPISLSELVAVCGCSESGLHNAFKSSRGYTPM